MLKIIKHCRESLPTFVAGSMVGLAMDNTLEVTNCFPFPPDNDDGDDDAGSDYLTDMLKFMREVRGTWPAALAQSPSPRHRPSHHMTQRYLLARPRCPHR